VGFEQGLNSLSPVRLTHRTHTGVGPLGGPPPGEPFLLGWWPAKRLAGPRAVLDRPSVLAVSAARSDDSREAVKCSSVALPLELS
jgi:hypothetical protein